MTAAPYLLVVAGEDPPFLSKTKAQYSRLMEAILKSGASTRSAFSFNSWDEKGDFILALEIPVSSLEIFKTTAKCSLRYSQDIQVGMTVSRSVKWVDEKGERHTTPYPGVNLGDGSSDDGEDD